MKNIFRFLMAVAVLFTASCAKEDISSSIAGGEVEVTFTASLQDLGSRAYGDGSQVNTLRFSVYDAVSGEKLTQLCGEKSPISASTPTTVNLVLLKGMKYNITFWADCNKLYNFDGQVVTVDYDNVVANDEERDAFYAYVKEFDPADANADTTIELYRPFAQLNAISTDAADALANSGVTISKSTVTAELYNSFNLTDGTVSDLVEKTLTAGDILSTELLSMNYLFAPAEGYTPNVTFTFENNKGIDFGASFSYVPLKRNYRTNIIGSLLTKPTDFTVEIEADFNEADQVVATDAAAAQEALDNAVPGTVIKLKSGVNYGTLYLRPVAGSPATKVVDWVGNNYRWETYTCFENLTIIGAEGATIDAIQIEGGTYYNTAHSQAEKYPVMLSLVELKNVVIDGVTFTGKGGYDPQGYGNAINLSGSNIKVDGLTLKNCVLNNSQNNARLLYKTESTTHIHTYTYDGNTFTFTPSLKDITVTGCTFNGGYMGLELRETENVTITNNVFEVGDRNILLPVNSGCTYTGNVTITGNISYDAKERFVRMDGAGDAVVVIKDNMLVNYQGTDTDYIKVTNANNVTIENNTLTNPINTVDSVKAALAQNVDGVTILLEAGTYDGLSFINPTSYKAKNVTIIGKDGVNIAGFDINGWSATDNIEINGLTFKNVTFTSGLFLSTKVMANVTVENCNFVNDACIHQNDKTEKLTNLVVKDCTFTGVAGGNTTAVMLENTENVTISGCTFNNIDFNVLQGGVLTGNVLVDNNTVNDTGDRVFRFVNTSNVNITISNNTIVSDGDGDGELAKASNPTKVTLTNNTWNGKSDAEVASKLININRATVSTASELVEAIKNNNNGIKDIDLASDITVDQWIMFSEAKTIGSGQIITVTMDGLTIDGKGHTLTVNDIESASNGDLLFDQASNLNIKNLTIKYATGVAGGISLKSGVISKVNFVGGIYGIYPGVGGDILVEDCTFATNADALYFEQERDNLTINRCTFNQADKNVVLLRGDVKFTNNIVNSGRTVNVVSGSPVVTDNNFNNVRFKVYGAATATIAYNTINNLVFDGTVHHSTFTGNTLSPEAQAALDAMN